MAGVTVKHCSYCAQNKIEHEFQDKFYGKWNRVHNLKDGDKGAVCTVCRNGLKSKK